MDFEIMHHKVPNDLAKIIKALDAYVAILKAKRGEPALYLYDSDYKKVKRLADQFLPDGQRLDTITFRGLPVRNGGSKKAKRPGAKYNPDRIKL